MVKKMNHHNLCFKMQTIVISRADKDNCRTNFQQRRFFSNFAMDVFLIYRSL